MRRGQRNKWTYDNAPQEDGLVTICNDGIRTCLLNQKQVHEHVTALRMGATRKSLKDKLKEFGWTV